MPIGIEPTMTYQPNRWSTWPRYSGLKMPRTHATAIRAMSRWKYSRTAKIAPIWITAVYAVTPGSSSWSPSAFSAMVR